MVLFNKSIAKPRNLASSEPIQEDAKNIPPTDNSKRKFLVTTGCVLAGVASACAITPLLTSWMPNARTKRLSRPLQVDLSELKPGEMLIVEWDSKPIFILRRTQQMLDILKQDTSELRDPESRADQQPEYAKNMYRSINPEYAVLVGLCTHLGCVPQYIQNSFYCPCHGSCFDNAGRVVKNVPAPLNLVVPPYHFIAKNILVIGESK